MNDEIVALTLDFFAKQVAHIAEIKSVEYSDEEKRSDYEAVAAAIVYGLEIAELIPTVSEDERKFFVTLIAPLLEADVLGI